MTTLKACLFDLDGVIVDTAKYHYIAWRQIAQELGFEFIEHDNERLKGVSRQRSLEILLEVGGVALSTQEQVRLAEKKNGLYLRYIGKMTPDEILPGAVDFLKACRANGLRTALATASRNSAVILERLQIGSLFDVVMDGNKVTHTKPDPEVFLNCARDLLIAKEECAVFEDAEAGIEAAKAAHMLAIGIGNPSILNKADIVVPGLFAIIPEQVVSLYNKRSASA
jgi:beta-phosphoglucomutase